MRDVIIRPATLEDVDGLLALEEATFGDVGDGAAAGRDTITSRIEICNNLEVGDWFFVAEHGGGIVGHMVLIPTKMQPEECSSWDAATGDGTLSTFNIDGPNIYIVSLGVKDAPDGTSVLLMEKSLDIWNQRGGLYLFCSRMPGFLAANKKSGISAEDYWKKTRADGLPVDWLLREYTRMSGGQGPLRLLKDGWLPDVESGGHAVLFALNDSQLALDTTRGVLEMVFKGGT